MTDHDTMVNAYDTLGNTYVTYRAFITIIISMIVAGAALFGYILKLHTDQGIEWRATLDRRIDGVEARAEGRLKSIEDKLDSIIDKLLDSK